MISLGAFLAQHPHAGSLRKRRDRRLGAMHASRANALAYAAALTKAVVEPLARAGLEAARALRPHWPPPKAADALALDAKKPRPPRNVPPVIKHEVGRAVRPVTEKAKEAAPAIVHRTITANLGHVDTKLGAKVKASLGIEIRQAVLRDQAPIQQAMSEAYAENVDLITSIPDQYTDRLEEILADNRENNGSWEDAVGEIEDLAGVTQSRAELIARDQTMRMNSRFNEARQQSLGVTRYAWQTVGDDRVREAHQELDGTEHDWDDPPTDSDGNTGHPGDCGVNCLPGDSDVKFVYGLEKAYRRPYCGPLVGIVTTSGKKLRATPNHPVLTPLGWRPIGSLQEGDEIIEVSQEVADAAEAHADDRVPLIGDVFDALAKTGTRRNIAGRREQFHGDGSESDVHVVNADWPLAIGFKAEAIQCLDQFRFAHPTNARPRERSVLKLFARSLASAARIVASGHQALSFFGRHLREAQHVRFGTSARNDAGLRDRAPNEPTVYAERDRNRQLAVAAAVPRNDLAVVSRVLVPRYAARPNDGDPGIAQAPGQIIGMAAQLLGDIFQCRASAVSVSRVRKVGISQFSGHVYNLQTETGWFVSGGILTHNCRCAADPILDLDEPDDEESDDEDVAEVDEED